MKALRVERHPMLTIQGSRLSGTVGRSVEAPYREQWISLILRLPLQRFLISLIPIPVVAHPYLSWWNKVSGFNIEYYVFAEVIISITTLTKIAS